MKPVGKFLSFLLALNVAIFDSPQAAEIVPGPSPYMEACKFLVSVDGRVRFRLDKEGFATTDGDSFGADFTVKDENGASFEVICRFNPIRSGHLVVTSLGYFLRCSEDCSSGTIYDADYLAQLNRQLARRVWHSPVSARAP